MGTYDVIGRATKGVYGRKWTKPKKTKVRKVRRTRTVNGNVIRVLVKAPRRRIKRIVKVRKVVKRRQVAKCIIATKSTQMRLKQHKMEHKMLRMRKIKGMMSR